ncbi:hypothetical protein [Actinoplanes couchii]|uniref:PH domain-containing protein n=1 Tax=Actinoplanes couchii TaxID=403638 RepID=A0ABQ3XNE2_9ACTN|nr:hypothetical protein [Actinoplanes couchii]MDR6318094.1 hypothetical protein [Actinoplanes couchii]GID59990.1 hypothetical protein Aco03nite_083940 [Actinoplanes couchii]
MGLWVSRVLVRWRRWVLGVAAAVAVGGVGVASGGREEPRGMLAVALGAAVVSFVVGAVVVVALRWRGSAGFEIGPREFRTRRHAVPVFLGLFVLGGWAAFAAVCGWSWVQGERDGVLLALTVIFTGGLVFVAPIAWRGTGFTVNADGIHADRRIGRPVTIPWADLALGPIAHADQRMDLNVAGKGRLRVWFEDLPPGFAAAVVRHYAEGDRAGIGTEAEHQRLAEMFDLKVRPDGPPPSRARIVALAVGATVLFGTGVFIQALEAGFVLQIAGALIVLFGFGMAGDAFQGARARKLLAG